MGTVRGILVLVCFSFIFARTVDASSSEIGKGASRKEILTVRASAPNSKKNNVVLEKGDSVKLECTFESQSWSFVQWVKLSYSGGLSPSVIPANQTYMNSSTQITSVVIEDVDKEDVGNYSCISTTAVGGTVFEFHVVIKEAFFCDENLCLPNGECVELLNGYVCSCHAGYVGKHCELEDPCRQNPCLNNGNCTTTGNTFNCSCEEGFGGDKCERESCTPASCNRGGSCSESSDGNIKCNCSYDRAGERCQHRCTFNTSSSRNHDNCRGKTCVISSSGQERCECHRQTSSNYCIMESDVRNECTDPNICNRRGNCRDYTYKYSCDCHSYASGRNCEFYNECASGKNVCRRNGARCVDLPVGYKCTNCPTRQYGDKCQYSPNPCKVTCLQTSMDVRCDLRFLNEKLSSVPIYFNSKTCQLPMTSRRYSHNRYDSSSWQTSLTVSYNSCGTDFTYEDEFIVYSNSLTSGEPNPTKSTGDIITRTMGHFQFNIKCRIPLYRNTSGVLTDMSLQPNETMELNYEGNINIPSSVAFYKDDWRSTISNYVVGDRLYVKLYSNSISNSLLRRYGSLLPVTCFATPDRAGNGPRYILLENECIKDETFRFEEPGRTRQSDRIESYFSFESFSFKNNSGELYLHCNARMCLNRTEYQNDDNFKSCKNSCKEIEAARETTIATTTTTRATTSLPAAGTDLSSRRKRSTALLSGIGSILDLRKEPSVVDRVPGPVVLLGQGQAPF